MSKPFTLFDFSDPAAVAQWAAVDDRVMGGVSRSRLRHDPAGYAVFEGNVSLEQNGGFASVRSTPANLGAPGTQTLVIDVRGDAKRFKINLLTDDAFDAINYQVGFLAETAWQTHYIPLTAFRATFRGREVLDAPRLDAANIRRVGLMVSDRQVGLFALDVRRIGLA